MKSRLLGEHRRELNTPHCCTYRALTSLVIIQQLGSGSLTITCGAWAAFQFPAPAYGEACSAHENFIAGSQSPLLLQDAAMLAQCVSETCTVHNMAVSVHSGLGNHFPLPYLYACLSFAFGLGLRLTPTL